MSGSGSRKTDEELLAELESLGVEDSSSSPSAAPPSPAKPVVSKAPPPAISKPQPSAEDDDVLRDLQAQLAVKPAGTSRPSTPRVSSSTTSGGTKRADHTPASSSGPPSGRTSEDRLRGVPAPARTSGEGRAYHQGVTPEPYQRETAARQAEQKVESGGGGWWGGFGGLLSTATAAVKQAESLAKEISGNEEALRWAEQVRGNMKNLQSFGTDLRSRALPTFTNLISHIAPPISAHERLQIHTTHDILNYPSLDPLIYSTFSRIMAQVEGGDLMVIQRGSENRSRSRATSEPQGYRGGVLGSGSGWTDGPWWRDEHAKRSLGTVPGLKEGTRLARVSAEAYAKEFFEPRGGVEEVARKATEALSETNPVRSSDIFLAIQAIRYEGGKELFADDGRREDQTSARNAEADEKVEEEANEDLLTFAIYLHDPLHTLSFSGLSQPFPAKWAVWLDAAANDDDGDAGEEGALLPDSIREIIASGGVDPREWVAEWMEEVLGLGIGVVAQRYVARRMGVGEGGIGRGRRRGLEEDGVAGEAARLRPHQAAVLNGKKPKIEDVDADEATTEDGDVDGRNARGTFSREHTQRHPETKWVHRGQGRYLPAGEVQRDTMIAVPRRRSRNSRSLREDFDRQVKIKTEQLESDNVQPAAKNPRAASSVARRKTEPSGSVGLSKQAQPTPRRRAPQDALTDALSGPPQYGLRRHRNSEPQPKTPVTESRSARLARRAKPLPSIEKHSRTTLRQSSTGDTESENEEADMGRVRKDTFDRDYVATHPEEVFHHTGNGWFRRGPRPSGKGSVAKEPDSERLTSKSSRKASLALSENATIHKHDLPKYPGKQFTHKGNGWYRPGPDPRGLRASIVVGSTSEGGQSSAEEANVHSEEEDDDDAEEAEEDEEDEEDEDESEGKMGIKATVSKAYKDAHPGVEWVHRGNGRYMRKVRISAAAPSAPIARSTEPPAAERRKSDATYSKAYILAHPDEEFYHTGNARWKRGSRPSAKSAPPESEVESESEDEDPHALFDKDHVLAHPHQVFHHRGQGRYARGPRPTATPAREEKSEAEDEEEEVDGIDRTQLVDSAFVDAHPNTTFHHKGQGRWAFGMPPAGSHNKIAVRGPGAKERMASKEQEEEGPPLTALLVKTEGPDQFPNLEWHYRGGGKWSRITKQEWDYMNSKPVAGQKADAMSKGIGKKRRKLTSNGVVGQYGREGTAGELDGRDAAQQNGRVKARRGRKSQQGAGGVPHDGDGSNGVSKSRSQAPKPKARMLEPHEDVLDDDDLPSIFADEWPQPAGPQDAVDKKLRATFPALNTHKVLASLTKHDPAVRQLDVLHALAANAQRALDNLQKEFVELDQITAQHAKIPRKPAKGGRIPADPQVFEDKKEAELYDYQFDPRRIGFQDPEAQRIVRDAEGRELRKRRNRSGVDQTDTVPGWRFGEEHLNEKRQSRQPNRFDANTDQLAPRKRMKTLSGGLNGTPDSLTPDRATPLGGGGASGSNSQQLLLGGPGRFGNVPKRIQQLRGESVVSARSEGGGVGAAASARKGRPPGSKNLQRRRDAGIPKGPRKRKVVVPEDGGEGVEEEGEGEF
ncbi:hypothetical protein B0A55_05670 [Friedmanniomyces simplex]|uniref:Uncharacterized protein n=1 Tax=Friedmanniomyces simplex TaxID=329884 RepID=A0A4U0XNW3_9PEZI|nr:hypothetical protein B0A55_05670 [Friedmanniomyces simplex]